MIPQLPQGAMPGDEEDAKPAAFKVLFEEAGADLVRITETPTRMILPMVRMSLIDAASDSNRKKSLIQIFQESLDSRMISRDRKGRIEAVQLLNARQADMDMDDIPL